MADTNSDGNFDAVTPLLGERFEKGSKPIRIGFKLRRELKPDRTSLVAEEPDSLLQANTKSLPVGTRQLFTASRVGVR